MDHLIAFTVTMLTITNPFGALAIFAGITSDRSDAEKNSIALKAGLSVAIVLLIVTWGGHLLLKIFGVTPPGLEVAGGVIIALMGLSMLHSKTSEMSHNKAEGQEAKGKPSIAVVPIAMPIIAGPGAITAVIRQLRNFHHSRIKSLFLLSVCRFQSFCGAVFTLQVLLAND